MKSMQGIESQFSEAELYPALHVSYSLNSLKGGYMRGYMGDYMGDYYRGY